MRRRAFAALSLSTIALLFSLQTLPQTSLALTQNRPRTLLLQQSPKFLQNVEIEDQNESQEQKFIRIPLEKSQRRHHQNAQVGGNLRSEIRRKQYEASQTSSSTHQIQIGSNVHPNRSSILNLTNNFNFDYIGTFYVGNPPQPIRGCFDTGSANAWILSSDCVTKSCKNGMNKYFTQQSSPTFKNLHVKEEIMFGSGKLAGYFGEDDFRIGFSGQDEILIHNQTVGLIVEEAVLDPDYDAIIGLAYPKMASTGLPIFDSMIQQKLLDKNIFSFYMAMNPKDQSELVFGGYDASKFSGDIVWHPVVDKLFWSLNLDDIKFNGIPLNICKNRKRCMVTPDSGTSLMTMPSWAHEIMLEKLPYQEDCENKYGFGTLTFVIDGIDYNVPSHHFMERYINVFELGDSVCTVSIQPLDIEQDGQSDLFIVGDSFMQIYYSIFDRDNDKVGLAKAIERKKEQALQEMDYYQQHGAFNSTY